MNTLLRKLVEWKARRRAAQIIVFDGGAEIERTRAFLKGALVGTALTLGLFLLTAPTLSDSRTMEELQRRETLVQEANQRVRQAVAVADVCLSTAEHLEKTIDSYHALLRRQHGREKPTGSGE